MSCLDASSISTLPRAKPQTSGSKMETAASGSWKVMMSAFWNQTEEKSSTILSSGWVKCACTSGMRICTCMVTSRPTERWTGALPR